MLAVNAASMSVRKSIVLQNSDLPDFENQGSGVPNYLGPAVISPDGTQAWVPSKQDNIKRGALRDGTGLNFQSTVRAVSSRIDLAAGVENYEARIDHDNAGVASAAIFDQRGMQVATVGDVDKVVLKTIGIARDNGATVDIDTGLNATDRVIDAPPDGLVTGTSVRVAKPSPQTGAKS